MDVFDHMTSVLTTIKSNTVDSVVPLVKKRTRRPSTTQKYVFSRVRVYGTSISALSYCVMERLLEGKTNEQIAEEFGLNVNSVHQHKGTVSKNLGIERSELLPFLKKWKEDNPQACLVPPKVEVSGTYQVDGVTLTKFKYAFLKDLMTKDIDTIARERKVTRSVVTSRRYDIAKMFCMSWEDLEPRVKKFWEDNPPA